MYVAVVFFGIFTFLSIGVQFVKEEKERREENLKKYKIKIAYEAYYDNTHSITEYNIFMTKIESTENIVELGELYNSYFNVA